LAEETGEAGLPSSREEESMQWKPTASLTAVAVLAAVAAFAQGDLGLARLRSYTSHRVSSHDRSGGNDDGNWGNPIKTGETRTIAEIEGPAVISHIWITIATPERWHLKKIVLRMYWDDEGTPSVEAPVGDFFGLGLGEYFLYEADVLSVGAE